MRVVFAHPVNFCFFLFLVWYGLIVLDSVGLGAYSLIISWREKRNGKKHTK